MDDLAEVLRESFQDKEYRDSYADSSLDCFIAAQIKVLREQRGLSQKDLGELAGMAQERISVIEDVNYANWSLKTLRRLAHAFNLRLSVKFETFSSLVDEIQEMSKENLQRESFADDRWESKP